MISMTNCYAQPKELGEKPLDLTRIDYGMDVRRFLHEALKQYDDETKTTRNCYETDTSVYYNEQTDERYPDLIRYKGQVFDFEMDLRRFFYEALKQFDDEIETNEQTGERFSDLFWDEVQIDEGQIMEIEYMASLGSFTFNELCFSTTLDNKLVAIEAVERSDSEGRDALIAELNKRYGQHRQGEKGKRVFYRWETQDEFIQLSSSDESGESVLAITTHPDDESNPIEIGNPDPFVKINLYFWNKQYNDLILIHGGSDYEFGTFENERDNFHAQNGKWYTPKIIKPFLLTQKFIDSLASSEDVWGKIQRDFYYLPGPDETIPDTEKPLAGKSVNKTALLKTFKFGAHIKEFKGNLSNYGYIRQKMRNGISFAEILKDTTLCDCQYLGEVEWKEKKRTAGVAYFTKNGSGSFTAEDFIATYTTLYDFQLNFDETLKKSMEESDLDLNRTTAQYTSMNGYDGAFLTDGVHEYFTPVMSENGISKGSFYVGRIYPIIDVIEEVARRWYDDD